ncbi:TRAP transporter permease [Paenalcaligenes niemegkensis]|nr:TRAP transporter large permease subunit [Paenalcaligenes niemegkensis]MCQ9617894.1 TRAP transporter permease [Paenalcaligenes niemegkensis]
MTVYLILMFLGLALTGMPLAFALGMASVAAVYMLDFELVVMPQRMMHAVNSFPLMAIPLFILAGELMVRAHIMERLIAFANSMVGRVHGGWHRSPLFQAPFFPPCPVRLWPVQVRWEAHWCRLCVSTTLMITRER